ncbi:two-component regulator propeller domain-containing protein [Pedobacter panaciterrae]
MKAFCLFFLLLLPFHNYAQKGAAFSNLSMENGLSQNSVISIAQDQKHFLWFGTRRGLNRYDGFQFRIYTNNPKDSKSIPHNVIDCLLADSFGQLWIGTINGLSRYDNKNDNFIKVKILNDTINCIYEDPQKNLWVGTYNGLGLLDRKSGKFKIFRFNKLDKNQRINNIYSLFKDHEQNLWVGTGYGLIRMTINNGQSRAVLFKNSAHSSTSISANYITSITSDKANNIWIGTDKGLNLYQTRGTFAHYTHNSNNINTLVHNDIRDIICNKDGTLWIGTQEGLSILNPKTKIFTNYKHNPDQNGGLTQNSLHSIFQDVSNTVWIGSFYGGVDALFPYSTGFKTYRASGLISSLSSNIVSTIVEDDRHNLWIGTEGGGLNHFNRSNNTYTHYKSIPGNNNTLPSNLVKTVLRQKNGNLIIGMHEGLISIFNPATKAFTRQITNVKDTSNNRGSADIMTILEDSSGMIWVGSRDGLNNISSSSDHTLKSPIEKKLLSRYVQTLFEDADKNIWIGTTKGLHLYYPKTGKLAYFTKKKEMPIVCSQITSTVSYKPQMENFVLGPILAGFPYLIPEQGNLKPTHKKMVCATTMYLVLLKIKEVIYGSARIMDCQYSIR